MKPTAHFSFPLLLFVRTYFNRTGLISLIVVLSVAASVAMATGLQMSAQSAEAELRRTSIELTGAAELSIGSGAVGVHEELLAAVEDTPGVRVAAPMIEASFRLDGGLLDSQTIHVIGIDLLLDPDVRSYGRISSGTETVQPLYLLADPRAVVVSAQLADDLALRLGDALPVRHGIRELELGVRGILSAGGVAEAFGGQIAIMDVYSLQTLVDRQGWLDRIDVVIDDGADLDLIESELSARLAGRATVTRSSARSSWVSSTLAIMRVVISCMVAIAILVASLLAHGAMSLFANRRAAEFSLLRTVGLESSRARRLLYLDAFMLSLAGTALGLLAGVALSRLIIAMFTQITTFLDGVELSPIDVSSSTLALGCMVGLIVGLAGVVAPARKATSGAPLDDLAASTVPTHHEDTNRHWLRLLTLVALWVAAILVPIAPVPKMAALFGLGLLLIATAAQAIGPTLISALRRSLERFLPGLGRIAGASLVVRPARTGVHLGAIAGVLAGVTATGVLAESLASTLDYWIASQYPGGVFVTAGTGFSIHPEEPIKPEVVDEIRQTPGVRAVFDHWGTEILFRGEAVFLGAGSMSVMAQYGRLPAIDREPAALANALATGAIAVSSRFSERFDVRTGDDLLVDTPRGQRRFEVAGLIRDFAGPTGSLNVDIRTFDELWNRPGSRDLVIWTDEPSSLVVRDVASRVGDRQDLAFVYGDHLASIASRTLSRLNRVLILIASMIATLGGLAVFNLLLGAVAERKRELALLRSSGATRVQIGTLILTDAMIAGLLGGLCGTALGVLCAWPFVQYVIPDALGWRLDFEIAVLALARILTGVLFASLLAGLYPAFLAWSVAPRDVFAPD